MGGFYSRQELDTSSTEQRESAKKEKVSQEEKKNTEGSDCGLHMNPHGTFNGCHFTINNGSKDITNQEESPNRRRNRFDVPVNPVNNWDYDSFRNEIQIGEEMMTAQENIDEIIQNTLINRPLDVDLESMRLDSSMMLEANHFDGIEQARGLESRASIVRNPTGDGLGLEMDENLQSFVVERITLDEVLLLVVLATRNIRHNGKMLCKTKIWYVKLANAEPLGKFSKRNLTPTP
ncbi:hypothetical protein GCK72_019640 [Caenorhabditis remanei]|uniref:Uncharacterized protein n=1 Tax=Caenorhabditis remanei TaxID=31234 RepID=A0A6A5GEB9_CAERE|nr:hypothetical protein GCK72_019640 [Caenorhabditis remanei]KAF1753084.1 hypothetical protein GCK72_019640 [Caenorhabditis remanei]